MTKSKADIVGRFKPLGIGSEYGQQPISVMYPSEIDGLLRSLPNRSDFIRDAVVEKLRKEGLLQPDQGDGIGAA